MKICVIGSGTMGNGIVQTFATKGHKVVIKGHRQESLDKAIASLDKGLSKLVEKGKITSEDKDITMSNISTTLSYEDIKAKNYSFSAGQYFDVKIEYIDITKDEFDTKMKSSSDNLEAMFGDSKELEDDIKKQLKGISFV